MKTGAQMGFSGWAGSPIGWLTIKSPSLAVGEAWILSGTGNCIIVKMSSAGELNSVPAGKKMQLAVKGIWHLKNMNKIITVTEKKLDSVRGEWSWGEIHERPEMISHQWKAECELNSASFIAYQNILLSSNGWAQRVEAQAQNFIINVAESGER